MNLQNDVQIDLKPVSFHFLFLTTRNKFYLYMSILAHYLYLSIAILHMVYIHIHSWLYAGYILINLDDNELIKSGIMIYVNIGDLNLMESFILVYFTVCKMK